MTRPNGKVLRFPPKESDTPWGVCNSCWTALAQWESFTHCDECSDAITARYRAEAGQSTMPSYARLAADLKAARATLTQANICITQLVAALHEIAPGHPLLEELPFCQYVPEPGSLPSTGSIRDTGRPIHDTGHTESHTVGHPSLDGAA